MNYNCPPLGMDPGLRKFTCKGFQYGQHVRSLDSSRLFSSRDGFSLFSDDFKLAYIESLPKLYQYHL